MGWSGNNVARPDKNAPSIRLLSGHTLRDRAAAMRRSGARLHSVAKYILTYVRGTIMKTAKVFKSGNSQAVRIPKEFQLESDEVEIRRRGDSLVLRPKAQSWEPLIDSLTKFTDDFLAGGRRQSPPQKRDRAF